MRSSMAKVFDGSVHPFFFGTTREEIGESIESMLGLDHLVNFYPVEILPDNMEPCGKKWFRSKAEAEAELPSMRPTRGPKFRLNAYYCEGCDGFHIGHTRIKPDLRRRKRTA